MQVRLMRTVIGAAAMLAVGGTSVPSMAQDDLSDARMRKIEAEVRALQRTVFPGGDGRFFEPQITAESATGTTGGSVPSTTAVTDILARMDAMESQIQSLTAQSEENANSIRLLTTQMASMQSGTGPVAASGTPAAASTLAAPAAQVTPTPSVAATPAVTAPSASRVAAVQAITKPQTDDAADDEYSYGYRLWNAGFYPEAQQQLAMFVENYPSHWRVTYGRNLLGRAYLDDNQPREAAPWFLRNYQADKQAARAPDSLLYLAESMIAMGDTSRACIALAEFGETYPALASGRLSDKYESDRRRVTCN